MAETVTVTPDQMFSYYQAGAVGTKEFRSWLAQYDSLFKSIRDPDVDNEIDRLARHRREALEQGFVIDREGNVQEQQ